MNYDFYVDQPQGDVVTQVRLLVTKDEPLTDYLLLMHGKFDKTKKQLTESNEFDNYIAVNLDQMGSLSIRQAEAPNLNLLPPGSWFLQFIFTLAKPWISKDDDPFYVAESVNPVRKDKVFKVPFMSAASLKGLLRWTLMHIRLALKTDKQPEGFAQERFVQTLMFGDEQGEEAAQVKGFAKYLDALNPEAHTEYERLLRQYYKVKPEDPLPHHSGRLMFYPTFFNEIDVEVINPHSRKTKAGTHPIYLECVPAGAKGTFSLLYVPFDLIGQPEEEIRKQATEDLRLLAQGLQAMFLTYGFSAKRTDGFGVAEQKVENGFIQVRIEETPAPPTAPPHTAEPQLPKYLQTPGKLKDEYIAPDGTFRERSQAELAKITKPQKQEYEKAKKWWELKGKAQVEQPPAPAEPQPGTAASVRQWLKRDFDSFDQLVSIAIQLAQEVKNVTG